MPTFEHPYGAITLRSASSIRALAQVTLVRREIIADTEFKGLIVWNKNNAGMSTFYRSKHELIFAMKNGSAKHINNFGLGEKGRYRTNVWDYPGVNSWGENRAAELAMHPTVKPVAMIADAIKDCSKKRGLVLDAFCGSGTTIMAAEATGRRARAIELDPYYVDVAVRRWQDKTGGTAVHVSPARPFPSAKKAACDEARSRSAQRLRQSAKSQPVPERPSTSQ